MQISQISPEKKRLLEAVLPHVPFDGWSDAAVRAGIDEIGVSEADFRAICPRGAVDLAVAAHQEGDAQMVARLQQLDMADMRFRDRVATSIRLRLEVAGDKEVVRRAATLFSTPHMAAEGAKLMWNTADAIWNALGDTSRDANWYSKRATLSAVYSACVLFWLGDESANAEETNAFIDRRIENVMSFEKFKAKVRGSATLKPLVAPLESLLSRVRAPEAAARDSDLPGYWDPKTGTTDQ